jgi:hypothetical protein
MSKRSHFLSVKKHDADQEHATASTAINGLVQILKVVEKVADAVPVAGFKPAVSGLLQVISIVKVRIVRRTHASFLTFSYLHPNRIRDRMTKTWNN